jgi:hypothetical protein
MNTTAAIDDVLVSSTAVLRMVTAVLGCIVYATGFTGNFLSLLLFIQKELRQVSTGLIFLLLNIFSTIHLLSLIVEFLDSIFKVQIFFNDKFRCQFILWLQNATRTICSFLAATVSIDRFIRSEYPMKSRIWCTIKNVMKLFTLYFIFSILFYGFFFHPANVFDSSGQCSYPYDQGFRLYALNIMPPLRFLLICIIPTVLMVGCGGRMLINIRQAKSRVALQKSAQNPGVATVGAPGSKGTGTAEDTRRKSASIDQMLFLMVLSNVIAYIITQIPFNIYTLYYGYETSDNFTFYSLMRAFLLMWSSIYFGIGFYLYCVTSPQFRKQFITKIKSLCICYGQCFKFDSAFACLSTEINEDS